MGKIKQYFNKVRRKYYDRMMFFSITRALATENTTMREIWVKHFYKYFNKLMAIEEKENVSFITNTEGS